MRCLLTLAIGVCLVSALGAQNAPPARYGVGSDLDTYPQKTAKECFGSVLKAIEQQKLEYLLAQLADPQFVDMRVKALSGGFRDLVQETKARLGDDPQAVKELRRFFTEGMWEDSDDTAAVKLKDVKNRTVFFRKVRDRWFLENRQK